MVWKAIIGTVLGGIILFLILPGFESLRKSLWARLRKRPIIKTRKHKDRFQFTKLEVLLRWINDIRSFPDKTNREVQDCLQMLRLEAEKIKKRKHKKLKQKVIEFSENEYRLYGNVSQEERIQILEGAFALMEDIREAMSPNYRRAIERD